MGRKWVRTEERLPPEWDDVHVIWDETVLTAYYASSGRWCERYTESEIAAPEWWAPLMELPESERKEAP